MNLKSNTFKTDVKKHYFSSLVSDLLNSVLWEIIASQGPAGFKEEWIDVMDKENLQWWMPYFILRDQTTLHALKPELTTNY